MEAPMLLKLDANPKIPQFGPGDSVKVNFRIREGDRERIQAFQGVVIRRRGGGPASNFTVRRITAGIGIERIFPLYSPLIESLEVTRRGLVRRAKLYYLRKLAGRAARIKEKVAPRRQLRPEATLSNVSSELAPAPNESGHEAVLPSQPKKRSTSRRRSIQPAPEV
jgi:large subunit ribosomal protein L19